MYFHLMLINNSFSTVGEVASNSVEFVFGALLVDGFLSGGGMDK